MEYGSIYKYMKLGIVHFKAYPEVVDGNGPVVETLQKIVEDDFWTAVEVGWMRDVQVRNRARRLLEMSHMEVCYATQPRVLSQKLNLNAFDDAERGKALDNVKKGIDEAYQLGAKHVRVLSGRDPGDEKREEAKRIFADSLKQLCRYAQEQGDIRLYLKIFDRSVDKKALIGHFRDAADVAEEVCREFKNFGVLSDLSHFPLLGEKPEQAIPLVEKYPMHFHIGNCVMRERTNPMFGDLQPRFGAVGGELDTEDLRDHFKLLLARKLLNAEHRPVLSVEVRPLLAEETSELIIANTKRVIREAWATAWA